MTSAIAVHPIFHRLHQNRGLVFPFALIGLLFVILVPLPPPVLDFLLICNLTLSVIVLVTTIYVRSPLEFAAFPSLLLALTLFRLVLNAATTRLVLTAGAHGPASAVYAAGQVVATFSSLVTAGSLAVGVIIFIIIVVIQFLVITKGATRISEVAARFTLDAMPGKQMAIDAELNAGILTDVQARQRRKEVGQEADFYGAMDGASKFVRGDAIAAIIITFINILGGLYVGLAEKHWPLSDCLSVFTRLTIGDGLVSQVPAFVVSLAAGLIVTRSSSAGNLGEDLINQVLAKPRPLIVAAIFLGVLSLTSLPKAPLLLLGGSCGGVAYLLTRNERRLTAEKLEQQREQAARKEPEKVEKLLDVDAMELDIGYGLVRLVDAAKGGDLLDRVTLMRRQIALALGIIVPPIRIRDRAELQANDYVIRIKGQSVARGVTYPEQFLSVDHGGVSGPIPGATATTEPALGLPAYWITEPERLHAEQLGYAVTEAMSVLVTHLTEIVRSHAHELLTRQEVKNLLENLKQRVPALVEEVVPGQIKPGELQKVMQNLLRERVPVRDLETILETLGDFSSRTKDLDILTEYVRNALSRTLCKQYVDDHDRIWALTLDPAVEELIGGHIERGENGEVNTMPAPTSQRLVQRIGTGASDLTRAGRQAVVLCSPAIRRALRRLIEPRLPHVAVMAYNEIVPDVSVEAVAIIGLNE